MSKIEALKLEQAAAEAEELQLGHLAHENAMKEENTAARLEYYRVLDKVAEAGKAYAKLSLENRKAKSAEHYREILEQSAAKKAFDIVCLGQEAYDAYRKAGADYVRLGGQIEEAEYAAKRKK